MRHERLVAMLGGLCMALVAACVWLVVRDLARTPEPESAADPDLRAAVAARLAERVDGFYDSHPDAEVGRVLLAERDGPYVEGLTLRTNAVGMRERDYELPKPAGTVRVVLLGDSFVFGWRVAAEERLGVHLERLLVERAGAAAPRVECLHLAVPSWNLTAQCAYLARQLELLQPDLVLQVTTHNDLDDGFGVRGFGASASFVPTRRADGDSVLMGDWPRVGMGIEITNFLNLGLDGESRERFRAAGDAVLALREALAPVPHVLVLNWGPLTPVVHRELGRRLPQEGRFYLPEAFLFDPANTLGDGDIHWSPAGHERMARVLYGLIVERELLPGLAPAPLPEAADEARALVAAGEAEAAAPLADAYRSVLERLDTQIDFRTLDAAHAVQVHGGVDGEGRLAPYAALLLRRGEATRLVLTGRALPDASLRGARVDVFLDELRVGTLTLEPDAPIDFSAPVPEALAGRAYLSLRLAADDFVYRGADLRRCVVLRLERVALER